MCMYVCIIIATHLPVWLDMGKYSWFQNGSITQKGKLGSSGREGGRDINMIVHMLAGLSLTLFKAHVFCLPGDWKYILMM